MVTVNGQREPTIHMQPGEVQRWRFVNATLQAAAQVSVHFPAQAVVRQDGIRGFVLLLLFAYAISWIMAYVGLLVPSAEVVDTAVPTLGLDHHTVCWDSATVRQAASRSTSSSSVWPNAVNSWPSVIGTASWFSVRPIFRT